MPAACWHIFYGRMREVKKGEGMKLAIIYPDQEGWTVDRFRESAEERGIEVQTIAVTDGIVFPKTSFLLSSTSSSNRKIPLCWQAFPHLL